MKQTDILVIGAGPAGISAALYLARAGASFEWLEKSAPGGKLINIHEVDNYPGVPKANGFELVIKSLHDQLNRVEKNLKEFESRINVEKENLLKKLDTDKAEFNQSITAFKSEIEQFKGDLKGRKRALKEKEGQYTKFFNSLLSFRDKAQAHQKKFEELGEHELLLTNNVFEDERIKYCIDILEPMISYFQFQEDLDQIYKDNRKTNLIDLNITEIAEFIKRDTVFENEATRLPAAYKDKDVPNEKRLYEKRLKNPFNIISLLYPIVESNKARILEKPQDIENPDEEEEKDDNIDLEKANQDELANDNAIYCDKVALLFPEKMRRTEKGANLLPFN